MNSFFINTTLSLVEMFESFIKNFCEKLKSCFSLFTCWICAGSFLLRNLKGVFVIYHCACWFTVGLVIQNQVLCQIDFVAAVRCALTGRTSEIEIELANLHVYDIILCNKHLVKYWKHSLFLLHPLNNSCFSTVGDAQSLLHSTFQR